MFSFSTELNLASSTTTYVVSSHINYPNSHRTDTIRVRVSRRKNSWTLCVEGPPVSSFTLLQRSVFSSTSTDLPRTCSM